MAKTKKSRKEVNQTKEDLEFEKQKGELTFAPKLCKRNASFHATNEKGVENPLTKKAIDETVERMQRARKVSEL